MAKLRRHARLLGWGQTVDSPDAPQWGNYSLWLETGDALFPTIYVMDRSCFPDDVNSSPVFESSRTSPPKA
jgi:hypothetical protein